MVVKRGIFGGTFDPIHFGHIHAIAYSIDVANIDLLHVMVARDPYQKQNQVTPSDIRFNWVKLALEEFYGDSDKVLVDNMELVREGPTYTIDTLMEMREIYGQDELVLVVGEDIIESISTWKNYEEIEKLAEIFVVPRSIFPTSSSYIREMVGQKRPITGLLPKVVEQDIQEKGLYN